MADDEVEEPENPEIRYSLSGDFDEASHDNDRKHFPEYFDDNGWPRFGDFDRESLVHPITKRPWYLEPRIPDDEDTYEYWSWYALATDYEIMTQRVYSKYVRPKIIFAKKVYGNSKISETDRNHLFYYRLKHLREDLEPRLKAIFAERSADLEFVQAWGEFNALAGSLGLSSLEEEMKQKKHRLGKQHNKDETLYWYLLMERDFKEQGKSVDALNKFIRRTIHPLVKNSNSRLTPVQDSLLMKLFRVDKNNKEY